MAGKTMSKNEANKEDKTIKIERTTYWFADYHGIDKRIIRDIDPRKKQGVSGYWIDAYIWRGKRRFVAIIDACWFTETIKEFDNIRDASNFIKKYMYT